MLADSDIVPECVIRPRSLGGLLTLYEANYLKLSALLGGEPGRRLQRGTSRTEGDFDLHFTVEDDSRYTRVLRLTYLFADAGRLAPEPDVAVKLYLDARVAEVASWAGFHRHPRLRGIGREARPEIDRRWACNMALGKWLDFLVERGHRLAGAARGVTGCRDGSAGGTVD